MAPPHDIMKVYFTTARLGISLNQAGKVHEAVQVLDRAMQLLTQLKEQAQVRAAHSMPQQELPEGGHSHHVTVAAQVQLNLATAYQASGDVFMAQLQYESTVNYATKLLGSLENDADKHQELQSILGEAHHGLAVQSMLSKKYQNALTSINRCLDYAEVEESPTSLARIRLKVAIMLALGRGAQAVPFLQQLQTATQLDMSVQPKFSTKFMKRIKWGSITGKTLTRFSKEPFIATVEDFVTEEEAAALRNLYHSGRSRDRAALCFHHGVPFNSSLSQNLETVPGLGFCISDSSTVPLPENISYSMVVHRNEDALIDMISDRIEGLLGLEDQFSRVTQLIHYPESSAGYSNHTDCNFEPGDNTRAYTVLIYLNTPMTGGQTVFPSLGLKIESQLGTVLAFRNLDSQGLCDTRTHHYGAPLKGSSKLVLQKWYYMRDSNEGDMASTKASQTSKALTRPGILCDMSGSCREYSRLHRVGATGQVLARFDVPWHGQQRSSGLQLRSL